MNEITVTELSALPDAVIVDVREDDEYANAHIPGVTHIPLSDFVARVNDVPDASPVYVVCAAGGRSAQAVSYLAGRGIDAVNVAGGTIAWQQAGLPVQQGA
ncbi:rhodanese-like domain-containing protein [Cryobacterium psychrophilum]|uniref:Rhodanese-like domain-containing protein n=1 Tax=Cryobacterium psychrophilum TaxID=41988 RepID=A0A4Y8KKM2_9MICO|nr:rhodanese-like domain-containing protein [Cryobacterium psychrophilum]TDW30505.1 rhodanese-related sulfurtransferase [Cryobacterium psychrophilum]TFD76322.1 rhodanese-like domain-containing protein [Cryobacterium psychrophilum]